MPDQHEPKELTMKYYKRLRYLKDLNYVYHKKMLLDELSSPPRFNNNSGSFNDSFDQQKQSIIYGWKELFGKSILNVHSVERNPLRSMIDKLNIDIFDGGYFQLQFNRTIDIRICLDKSSCEASQLDLLTQMQMAQVKHNRYL